MDDSAPEISHLYKLLPSNPPSLLGKDPGKSVRELVNS